jgi:hypothetical protein
MFAADCDALARQPVPCGKLPRALGQLPIERREFMSRRRGNPASVYRFVHNDAEVIAPRSK